MKIYLSWRGEGAVWHLRFSYPVALLACTGGAFKEDQVVEHCGQLLWMGHMDEQRFVCGARTLNREPLGLQGMCRYRMLVRGIGRGFTENMFWSLVKSIGVIKGDTGMKKGEILVAGLRNCLEPFVFKGLSNSPGQNLVPGNVHLKALLNICSSGAVLCICLRLLCPTSDN